MDLINLEGHDAPCPSSFEIMTQWHMLNRGIIAGCVGRRGTGSSFVELVKQVACLLVSRLNSQCPLQIPFRGLKLSELCV